MFPKALSVGTDGDIGSRVERCPSARKTVNIRVRHGLRVLGGMCAFAWTALYACERGVNCVSVGNRAAETINVGLEKGVQTLEE